MKIQHFGIFVDSATSRESEIATYLAALLSSRGHSVSIELGHDHSDKTSVNWKFDHVLHLGGSADAAPGPAAALRDRCLSLKRSVARASGNIASLWVVTAGVFSERPSAKTAVETGVWKFGRTIANEFPAVDVRRIDIDSGLAVETAAKRLDGLLSSGTAETELIIGKGAIEAVRVERLRGRPKLRGAAKACRLDRSSTGGIEKLRWVAAELRPPRRYELQIEVEASGLNFRDVMLTMSLLPDDVLEDGFAGASLGLEVAGRVSEIGEGVQGFRKGDRVVSFASSGFATHVTVPSKLVAKVPDGISVEAAATIPVAFCTAYYALIVLGRIRRNEWILIHGGAGGVGMAAIQIAQWRGANVIATAGSEEKRTLLSTIGVEHVLDSRSMAFVEQVRSITGHGAHVVLNSLSGDAMQRSLEVLRPFGRFVELGKRDYVANTHVGLRPFRKNLSYFGVDLDQLLSRGDGVGRRLVHDVMKLFAARVLTPLPYRAFSGAEIVDAFRLMQQSGHVGKIVVRSSTATASQDDLKPTDFVADSSRTHVITGGFGGFGAATARWLASRGAHHIAIVSRSGPTTSAAQQLVTELQAKGVNIRSFTCDVADEPGLFSTLETIRAEMPPLAGVIHSAMVLQDGLITSLDREKMDGVLRPKVSGAINLDKLTRGDALDYFVLFSSATTLVGNPGQGNYVAANGFMEGLANRRRREGLPALAIAWGAIADVGELTKNAVARERLVTRMGIKPMPSHVALELMSQVLSGQVSSQHPVIAISPMDWGTAQEHVPVLKSPTYVALLEGRSTRGNSEPSLTDIPALVANHGTEAAAAIVAPMVAEEISRVLRLPQQDVSLTKPLFEMGLDSLMAVELVMALQERFGDIVPSNPTSKLTVLEIARLIVGGTGPKDLDDAGLVAQTLIGRHMADDVAPDLLSEFAEVVEEKKQQIKGLLQ